VGLNWKGWTERRDEGEKTGLIILAIVIYLAFNNNSTQLELEEIGWDLGMGM
jgi:hypothetical protein